MFPDPTLKWQPYPSVIDGIERPPYVFDRGFSRGVLRLIVIAPSPHSRAYGVELPCEIYAGFDEMLYSVSGNGTGRYDGSVYVKEAASSILLTTYSTLMKEYTGVEPTEHKPRHFLFVGADLCYEAIGLSEPRIRALDAPGEAGAWGPPRGPWDLW